MDIILVAGLWLPSSIWSEVVAELARYQHRAIPVALPGVDDGSAAATLEDQVEAVLAAVDAADRPLVAGHSAASTLAWLAADRRPEAIRGIALIGGFPAADGDKYADFFPTTDGVMPFPGWEPFEGADSADLSEAQKEQMAAVTVPVPEGVSKGVVHLSDPRRYDLPVVLVCPEYTPDQARAWIDAGELPELARATRVSFVDIDSGHWPMVTCPAELARVLDKLTRENLVP
ncbi:MAG TPA: alpha/beta hydrolase [Acidimicrobiia bacterium]|nr:alpha/beta hydrolase [Acidimicrobiia bacterium]